MTKVVNTKKNALENYEEMRNAFQVMHNKIIQEGLLDNPEVMLYTYFAFDNLEKFDSPNFCVLKFGRTGDTIRNRYTESGPMLNNMIEAYTLNDLKGYPIKDEILHSTLQDKLEELHKEGLYSGIKWAGHKEDNFLNSSEAYYVTSLEDVLGFQNLMKEVIEECINKINLKKDPDIFRKNNFKLYDYQENLIKLTLNILETKKYSEVLQYFATRSGKSIMSLETLKRLGKNKIAIITPFPSADSFRDFVIYHHLMKGYHYFKMNPNFCKEDLEGLEKYVVFISFQSAEVSYDKVTGECHFTKDSFKFLEDGDYFDSVIIDEIHNTSETKRSNDIINLLGLRNKVKLFLSGTPFNDLFSGRFTKDNTVSLDFLTFLELAENFKDDPNFPKIPKLHLSLLDSSTVEELIRNNNKDIDWNISAISKGSGIKAKGLYLEWMLHRLNCDEFEVVDPNSPKHKEEGNFIVVYCENNAATNDFAKAARQSKAISEDFNVLSLAELSCDAYHITQLVNKFFEESCKEEKKALVFTCGKCTTGVTLPKLDGIYLLRNSNSEEFIQIIARALTSCEGKKDAYIYCLSEELLFNVIADYHIATNKSAYSISLSDLVEKWLKLINCRVLSKNSIDPTYIELNTNSLLGYVKNILNFKKQGVTKLIDFNLNYGDLFSEEVVDWLAECDITALKTSKTVSSVGKKSNISDTNKDILKEAEEQRKAGKTSNENEEQGVEDSEHQKDLSGEALSRFIVKMFNNIDLDIFMNFDIKTVGYEGESTNYIFERDNLCCYDYFKEIATRVHILEDFEDEFFKAYVNILNKNKSKVQTLINRLCELRSQTDIDDETIKMEALTILAEILSEYPSESEENLSIPYELITLIV